MQIPSKAIIPTPAEIPKFILVTCNAIIPPIKAKGTFAKTKSESFMFPKRINSRKNIPKILMGTTSVKRAVARC